MNFELVFRQVVAELQAREIRFAMIGGMAMAFRGLQRSTLDLDFILLHDDLPAVDAILQSHGYRREFRSENVSHYQAADADLGRIDLLHAFRPATLGMLERAESLEGPAGTAVPVVQLEDLVGLKVQASVNDPTRSARDWADIEWIVRHAGNTFRPLDWELIASYLSLFQLDDRITDLRQIHGQPE